MISSLGHFSSTHPTFGTIYKFRDKDKAEEKFKDLEVKLGIDPKSDKDQPNAPLLIEEPPADNNPVSKVLKASRFLVLTPPHKKVYLDGFMACLFQQQGTLRQLFDRLWARNN